MILKLQSVCMNGTPIYICLVNSIPYTNDSYPINCLEPRISYRGKDINVGQVFDVAHQNLLNIFFKKGFSTYLSVKTLSTHL